ncbi:MAG TPA: hypothetical protein VL137_01950 [Polyangiaceae bacterium]|jgi:hypothetical protein|nr:hypothetical protein [Polyangiaceae bacterium]
MDRAASASSWLPRGAGGLAALVIVATACQNLIDLGPRARDKNATTISACGFGQGSTSQACVSCLEQHCCSQNLACSEDPQCARQKVALTECVYDVPCIQDVLADAGTGSKVRKFSSCATGCTVQCYPTDECLRLAQCCQQLSSLERSGCADLVDSEDQTRCKEARTATFCPP